MQRELTELAEEGEYITSVKWIDGTNITFGDTRNRVQIWNAETSQNLRKIRGQGSRVCSLAPGKEPTPWALSSGSKTGEIQNYDVRQRNAFLSSFSSHEGEVSGLAWSADGKYLASGGNDNVVNIWSNDIGVSTDKPIHQFTDHQAGIKALSWCPWKGAMLASGGGKSNILMRNVNSYNKE